MFKFNSQEQIPNAEKKFESSEKLESGEKAIKGLVETAFNKNFKENL